VTEKGTKILLEADIFIASKVSARPYGSSVSSFPPSWFEHDVSGEVGERERKKLGQLSVIILTSAARFSSVSGPEIWREV
jgi:hypothetical protein